MLDLDLINTVLLCRSHYHCITLFRSRGMEGGRRGRDLSITSEFLNEMKNIDLTVNLTYLVLLSRKEILSPRLDI